MQKTFVKLFFENFLYWVFIRQCLPIASKIRNSHICALNRSQDLPVQCNSINHWANNAVNIAHLIWSILINSFTVYMIRYEQICKIDKTNVFAHVFCLLYRI